MEEYLQECQPHLWSPFQQPNPIVQPMRERERERERGEEEREREKKRERERAREEGRERAGEGGIDIRVSERGANSVLRCAAASTNSADLVIFSS